MFVEREEQEGYGPQTCRDQRGMSVIKVGIVTVAVVVVLFLGMVVLNALR